MRILIVHNEYQQNTGEYVAVQSHTSLLQHRGHSLQFFFRDSKEVQNYNVGKKISFFLTTIYNPYTKKAILDLSKEFKPEVAHVHNVFPLISPSVYLGLKEAGVPIVQSIYNFRFMCPNGTFYTQGHICERCKTGNTYHAIQYNCFRDSRVLSALYALTIGLHRKLGTFHKIDHFIVPARFTAQKLVEAKIADWNRISLTPLFLPEPLPELGQNISHPSYFIYVGRLTKEKGILTLINAFANLPHYQLKVIGDGPLRKTVQNIIKQEKLQNIELLGYIWGEQKWHLLKNATGSIIPSEWYENSPYSLLDSLAIGTPVIASRIGSLADIIEHQKNGLLFSPGNANDLGQQVGHLYSSFELRNLLSQHGRKTIENHHSSTAYYKSIEKIYNDLQFN